MPPQVIAPREAFVIATVRVVAIEHHWRTMGFLVPFKVLRVPERLLTFIALVRPLGRVGVDLLVTAAMISTKEAEDRATLLTWLHTVD